MSFDVNTVECSVLDETGSSTSAGHFDQILAAARLPYWHRYAGSRKRHLADGILEAAGEGRRATLSFDDRHNVLRLEVQLGRVADLPSRHLTAMLETQTASVLTRVLYDREDGGITLRSSTVWIDGRDSARIVKTLFADMKRTLEHEQVRSLCSMAA